MEFFHRNTSHCHSLALLLLLALVSGGGCQALALGYWLTHPNDVPAEYDGLKEKRVAVVCRGRSSFGYENAGVPTAIAKRVSGLLRRNVKEIEMIRQKDIDDWTGSNELDSVVELGKALDADAVVVIDLNHFSTRKGKTLYQGRANAEISVYDVATGESEELDMQESVYPPNNGVPTDISEARFRAAFVEVLAEQIARRFYASDSMSVFNTDTFYRG